MNGDELQATVARQMLRRVACANQIRSVLESAAMRVFYREDVEIALCAALSKEDIGLNVEIIGDRVILDGKERFFHWEQLSWGQARHTDLSGVITNVDERIKGLVTLQDGTDFENPMAGHSAQFELWERLSAEDEGVPLVKTLDVQAGEYQFKHLSFQEALFVEGVIVDEGVLRDALWSNNKAAQKNLCAPFLRNSFKIGHGYVGAPLAAHRSEWKLPKMDMIGAEALCHVLHGAGGLKSLDLKEANLTHSTLAQLAVAVKGIPLATVAVGSHDGLPEAFVLAVLTPSLRSLDCSTASLDTAGAVQVLSSKQQTLTSKPLTL